MFKLTYRMNLQAKQKKRKGMKRDIKKKKKKKSKATIKKQTEKLYSATDGQSFLPLFRE